jgi:excisionase family DNA binding protein
MVPTAENGHGDHIERQTLTVEEAARVLGISRSSAYGAARRGELPIVRIGRRYVVPRAALERLLDHDGRTGLPYR